MARGKHAASAAKRRAESAEEQLDRLLPKLVDAQHVARQYRSEAEQAVALRRRVAELTGIVGVPKDEHVAALLRAEAERDEITTAYEDAFVLIVERLARRGLLVPADPGNKFVDGDLLAALYVVGDRVSDAILISLEIPRDFRRAMTAPTAPRAIDEAIYGRPTHHAGLVELDGEPAAEIRRFRSARWEQVHEEVGT